MHPINQTAIGFIRNPIVNPFVGVVTKGFLFVESRVDAPPGFRAGVAGIRKSGFKEGVDFQHHDASTLDSQLDLLGTKYDSIVVASHGGGLLSRAELDILIARSKDIIDFINAGGGIYAMAETGGTLMGSDEGVYGFLPFIVSSHTDVKRASAYN